LIRFSFFNLFFDFHILIHLLFVLMTLRILEKLILTFTAGKFTFPGMVCDAQSAFAVNSAILWTGTFGKSALLGRKKCRARN
ncbi:MAG TPA: hypothetical protein VMT35_02790, partial [Ignavibacteriaceae bacterium]|nr:hypothetical protein [Ignavibacteriaceae bacterium]